jgi:WD40 repeat protein
MSVLKNCFFESKKYPVYVGCKFDSVCQTKIKFSNNKIAIPSINGAAISIASICNSDGEYYENEKFEGHIIEAQLGKPINTFEWSQTGKILAASARTDGQIRLWNPDNHEELLAILVGHEKKADILKFSKVCSNLLFSASV